MNDPDFSTIVVCAERYALGRQSYMPSLVIDFIERNLKYINYGSLVVMAKDIREPIWGWGDELIDKPCWMGLLKVLDREISKRESEKMTGKLT